MNILPINIEIMRKKIMRNINAKYHYPYFCDWIDLPIRFWNKPFKCRKCGKEIAILDSRKKALFLIRLTYSALYVFVLAFASCLHFFIPNKPIHTVT